MMSNSLFTKRRSFGCVVFLLPVIVYLTQRYGLSGLNLISPKHVQVSGMTSQKPSTMKSQPIIGVKPRLCQRSPVHNDCLKRRHMPADATDKNCTSFMCLCFTNNPLLSLPPVGSQQSTRQLLQSELELVHDVPVREFSSLPDPKNVKIRVLDSVVNMGDPIKIQVDLFDGYKKPVSRGGDHIVGWIQGQGHSMDSKTTDYKNGTYVLTFPSFWSGHSLVSILLKHLRESRHLHYKWKRSFSDIFYIYGEFISGNIKQITLCSYNPVIPGYKKTCNYTTANNDFSWYCGEPPADLLSCRHIKKFKDLDFINFPATETEMRIFQERQFMILKKNISIQVKGSSKSPLKEIPKCSTLSPKQTWNMSWPLGYFKHGEWTPINCHINQTKNDIIKFLHNTTLHLFGDSTTRQFYRSMQAFSKCDQKSRKWTSNKWYENSLCVKSAWNFTLLWTPHEMPFCDLTVKDFQRFYAIVLEETLKRVSKQTQRYIIVIHYYLHYRHPISAFQQSIRNIKSLLSKYPSNILRNVKIVFKGPHPFTDETCTMGLSDMIGMDYKNILFNELKAESHRIWYLDYWNLLNSVKSLERHPSMAIVWQMLRMMFGYIID